MTYEKLLIEYDNEVKVKEKPLKHDLKGVYKNGYVIIDSKLNTDAEKFCILAEEIGHHYTTSGDIIDQNLVQNIKQENCARQWAYEKLVGINDLINAFNANLSNKFEIADFLHITVEFLEEAINYYRTKYGTHYQINNYLICFEPTLGIAKLF